MYQHILFATDLTDVSEPAARRAWEIANQYDGSLYLIHCIEPLPAYGAPGFTDITSPYIDGAKKEMAELGSKLRVPEDKQFVVVGSIKQEVLAKAKEISADLLVVGTHGRHGLARLLGSTANAIAHGADIDVLMIRSKE
jgi:universal stress protein A